MPGKTKRKYVGELMHFAKNIKRPLNLILETLAPDYTGKDILAAFQKYYPYEWKEICERYEQYKDKDEFLQSCHKKKRYHPLPPEQYFFSLEKVKHILSAGYRKKHSLEYDSSKASLTEEKLKSKRDESIRKRTQKIEEVLQNTQNIEPAFVDALIAAYHRKGNTIDDKMEIFKEVTKYTCEKSLKFIYKLNDSERNEQIRRSAFEYLQKTGHYAKLRGKFSGKRKEYMTETTEFYKTPQDLAEELENDKSIQNRKQYDVFVSHSSKDAEIVRDVIKVLNKMKRVCYCDWVSDDDFLKRSMVSDYTREVLKKRMHQSKCIVYVSTPNSRESEWVKWELGYYETCVKREIYVIQADQYDEGKYVPLVYNEKTERYMESGRKG